MYSFDPHRINNFQIIEPNSIPNKWSTDWTQFPGIPYAIFFEKWGLNTGNFFHKIVQDYWWTSFIIVSLYLTGIFSLKKYMEKRKPFNLRFPLTIWSSVMTLFAVVGTIRCLPEFIDILSQPNGFYQSICNSSYYKDIRLNVWYWIFIMLKIIELGDTVFIVLRKKPLTSLHLVHHSTSLIFSWFVFGDVPGTARWMVNMNFAIHSFMYGYYTLKAMEYQIPRRIAATITMSQIIQMIIGTYVNVKAFQYKMTGTHCDLSKPVATAGAFIYTTFFILFLNFFIHSYIIKLLFKKEKTIKFIDSDSETDEANNNLKKKFE